MSDLGGMGGRGASPDERDALAVLSWGLRHYSWIILLSVCALGILGPRLVERTPETYEAQAQVGPMGALNLQSIDPLPRLGESLFGNGSVAEAVRQSFDPPLPRSEAVIPQRVSLIAAQDNVVLTVVGSASTPQTAADLANVAAETLADELNQYEGAVGSFTIQRRAVPPGGPAPRLGRAASVGVGGLAGLAVGLGIVGLLLVRRRPVLSVESAETATGALVLGLVWIGRTSSETRGLPQLCHTILAFECEELLFAGTLKTRPSRGELVRLLTEVLAGRRDVTSIDELSRDQPGSRPKESLSEEAPRLFVAQDASQSQLVTRSDRSVAVLVVPHGISRASLVRQVQQYLDGGAAGILLVRNARHRLRLRATTSPSSGVLRTSRVAKRRSVRRMAKVERRTVSNLTSPGTPVNEAASPGIGSSPGGTSAKKSGTGGGR